MTKTAEDLKAAANQQLSAASDSASTAAGAAGDFQCADLCSGPTKAKILTSMRAMHIAACDAAIQGNTYMAFCTAGEKLVEAKEAILGKLPPGLVGSGSNREGPKDTQLYDTLGVPADAPKSEIKVAYKERVKEVRHLEPHVAMSQHLTACQPASLQQSGRSAAFPHLFMPAHIAFMLERACSHCQQVADALDRQRRHTLRLTNELSHVCLRCLIFNLSCCRQSWMLSHQRRQQSKLSRWTRRTACSQTPRRASNMTRLATQVLRRELITHSQIH